MGRGVLREIFNEHAFLAHCVCYINTDRMLGAEAEMGLVSLLATITKKNWLGKGREGLYILCIFMGQEIISFNLMPTSYEEL